MPLSLVLGMHRSATSLLANVCGLLGADLGPPQELLGPDTHNPRGHFEHVPAEHLNNRLLNQLGGTWDAPPALPPDWADDPSLDDLRSAAGRIVGALDRGHLTVVKDPRMSLTAPFWATVSPLAPSLVAVRDPDGVIASLQRRGSTQDRDLLARLWLHYTLTSLRAPADLQLVDHHRLYTNPAGVAEVVAGHLGLPSPDAPVLADVACAVEPGLRHQPSRSGPAGPYLRAARATHKLLVKVGVEAGASLAVPHDVRDAEQLTATTTLLAELHRRSTLAADAATRAKRLQSELTSVQEQLRRLRPDLQPAGRTQRGDLAARHQQLQDLHLTAVQERRKLAQQRDEARSALERVQGRKSVRAALTVANGLGRARRRIQDSGPKTSTPAPAAPKRAAQPAPVRATQTVGVPTNETVPRAARRTATIIIPVHNAYEQLRPCLQSVLEHTGSDAQLLLIDDASTDPRVAPLLQEVADTHPNVEVLTNDTNLGFTGTVNRGMDACATDVVLLNSDTQVGPRWLEQLRHAAYQRESIATATALSDNAGAFSVPIVGEPNELPDHLPFADVARLVSRHSARRYPTGPTGNGFCMYLRRDAVNRVGPFDAEAFPRGYGEENDWCMRAQAAGYEHVVDDATLVRHQRSASFGDEKAMLAEAGRQVIDDRWPDYGQQVRAFVHGETMQQVREDVAATLEMAAHAQAVPTRVLYCVQDGGGGTPQTSRDLADALHPEQYEAYLLLSDTRTLRLIRRQGGRDHVVDEYAPQDPIRFGQVSRDDVRSFVRRVMVEHGIELVHVRHLFKHTFDVPTVAADLELPLVVSFHDFYMACPTVHMIDDNGRFCGGSCTAGEGRCRIPSAWITVDADTLKHDGVYQWRDQIGQLLDLTDAAVTTSPMVADVYRKVYPQLTRQPFEVIEHGRDLDSHDASRRPTPGQPLKVLAAGNLDVHKGAATLAKLRELDEDGRIELHLLGTVTDEYADMFVDHGRFARHEFADRVSEIQPSVAVILSTAVETYSHALSEMWGAGLPVVASDLGALRERIREHGGGWLVDPHDPHALHDLLIRISDNPDMWDHAREGADASALRSRTAMADDYGRLYRRVQRRRRALVARESDEPAHVDLLVAGRGHRHPGSVQVRTLRRWQHPTFRRHVDATATTAHDLLDPRRPDPDLLYVQRTAVSPHMVGDVLRHARERDVPVVFDIDDDLLSDELAADPAWSGQQDAARQLLRSADLVTVSTAALADRLAQHVAGRVAVLPNQLDERLWFPSGTAVETTADRAPSSPLRLLYAGSPTHGADLAMLRDLVAAAGVDVTLTVIGGEPDDGASSWYERLVVPGPSKNYPQYVQFLQQHRNQFDAAVAPLVDTPFNRCKSDLKFLEYSALGLPSVFSRVGPYADAIDDGVTGLLADNTVEAWRKALDEIAGDVEAAARMAQQAHTHVRSCRTVQGHGDGHRELILSLLR